MKRFVLPVSPSPEGLIRLCDKDYHYLVHVRRLKSGMCFDAILPGEIETKVRIISTKDNVLTGECLWEVEKQPSVLSQPTALLLQPPLSLPPIALFQSLPKGAKMDLIIRQAAEAGVSVVSPFESEYSAAKVSKNPPEGLCVESFSALKIKRWERIVREGRQQSGSVIKTEIRFPCTLAALLEYWESIKKEFERPLGILLHQAPLEKGTFHGYLGIEPDFVALTVGPEGGFSPGEVSQFIAAGFKPILLGNTILRTETAALYGVAAIRTILAERKAWTSGQTESCSLKSQLT